MSVTRPRAGTSHWARERYEQLVESVDGIVWEADAGTLQFTFVSAQAERLLGYPIEAWYAPGFWVDHLHPDDRAWAVEFCQRATREGRRHDFEVRMVALDGRTVWLRDIVSVTPSAERPGRLRGIMVEVTELKRAEADRVNHLRFLEHLDRVNRAIQATSDLDRMLSDVLDATLAIFACDRAWLLYPCDPATPSWHVPIERTRPEYPGALEMKVEVPTLPEAAEIFRAALAVQEPLRYGPQGDLPLPAETAARFGIRSQLLVVVRPKFGKPYLLGLHHCAKAHVWDREEVRLLREIGRRLADGLSSLLLFRDLRESERRLEESQRMAQVGHWERDLATEAVAVSTEACRILGLGEEGRVIEVAEWNRRWLERLHPDDLEGASRALAEALASCAPFDFESRVLVSDGQERVVHSRGEVACDASGRPRRMLGMMQDVTELRRTERELRASEARYRTFVDHATDAFFLHDATGAIVDVNRQACESLGYTREELLGKRPADLDPDIVGEEVPRMQARLEAGEVIALDTRHRRKDGTTFPVEIRLRAYRDGDRWSTIALVRDVSVRREAERALIESHRLLHAVIEGTLDAVFVKDLEGRYLMINSAGARLLGRTVEQVLGRDDRELFSPETAREVAQRDRAVIETGEPDVRETIATAAGVTRNYFVSRAALRDAEGRVVGVIGLSRDVTELKRLEEQFRQAQKMESIGRLAGGVAHDFNNLLTVINGYGEVVLERLPEGDPIRELVTEIRRSGERAATLTRQLLAFSRRQLLQPQRIGLNGLLAGLRVMLRRLIGEDIELRFQPRAEPDVAEIDPAQFEQAIFNLVVNARDAMPQGGRLTIATSTVELDGREEALAPEARPGRHVMVQVSDTGCGMEESTRARLFEPFFTTKELGKGTGLGLAMVYGFVKQSGGQIAVSSEPRRGTTFRIYLPLSEAAGELATPPTREAAERSSAERGSETLLLVEDEEPLRRLGGIVLRSAGYQVLEAQDGDEALRVSAAYPGRIDLLVTDLVMPRLNGRELAARLARGRPALRVLFVSGYADEKLMRIGGIEGGTAFLAKPFTPAGLQEKVREVLGAGAAAGLARARWPRT